MPLSSIDPTVVPVSLYHEYINALSQQFGEVVFVNSASDFGTPSSGVYTLEANRTYIVCAEVDLAGDRLVGSANTVIRGWSSENSRIKSTGLGSTALITSVYSLPMLNLTIEADVALDLVATDANQALDWNGVNFTDCATVGTIEDYNNVIWVNCALIDSAGLTFDGSIGTIGMDGCLLSGIAGETTIILPSTLTITRRFRIIYSAVVTPSTATSINVNSSATIPVEGYILDTVNFAGSGTHLAGVAYTDNKALFRNNVGVGNSASIGLMTMSGNATATTVAATNTEYKAAGTTTLDSTVSQKFTMPADNRLTYGGAIQRAFRATAVLSLTSNSNNQVGSYFAKNGSVIATSETYTTTDGAGRRENVLVQTIVALDQDDYLEVWVENATATQDITVTDMSVIVEALN